LASDDLDLFDTVYGGKSDLIFTKFNDLNHKEFNQNKLFKKFQNQTSFGVKHKLASDNFSQDLSNKVFNLLSSDKFSSSKCQLADD